ncbi:2-succinyl-5-enolpyruvyl-6-hydroxy-3-cyclohexene-1-carboxylate synthase [Escherichia coli]|nr:2-succinyl-5-enolpyruvyl-6-hydroxy-3-cyclohexene-1-carboxylate synthase [Escherichia coli]
MQAVIARPDAFCEAQLAHRIGHYFPEQGQLFVGTRLGVGPYGLLFQLLGRYTV